MTIDFIESTHTYIVDGDFASLSVTELLKKHGLAPDYNGVDEEVLQQRAEYGTMVHKDIENIVNSKKYEPQTIEGMQFSKWAEENLIGAIAEQPLALKYKDIILAGTADLLGIMKDKTLLIADHKTTSTIHDNSLAWQLSLYNYMLRHENNINGIDIHGWTKGADHFVCLHYYKGEFKAKDIEPINDIEIERLLECEANGDLYAPPTLVDSDDLVAKAREAEELVLRTKADYDLATKRSNELKAMLVAKFEEQGIKTFENERVRVTYVKPSTKTSVDSKKLKELHPDIYEECSKTSNTRAYVKITPKEIRDE